MVTQQVGARSTRTACATRWNCPYALFEDQRSGETLGKLLEQVRTDVGSLNTSR